MKILKSVFCVVAISIISIGMIGTGFTREPTSKQKVTSRLPQTVLIKEKKVRPIAGDLMTLPASKKVDDYFAVRSATDESIMVQYGIQEVPKDGIQIQLLKNKKEIQSIKIKERCGRIFFKGLTPDTKYEAVARLPKKTDKQSGTAQVNSLKTVKIPCRTLKKTKGKILMKLAVVSDTHIASAQKPSGRMHCESGAILKDVCQEANRRKCSVMIIAGDITNANLMEEYETAKQSLSAYKGTLLTVPGNHDDYKPEPKIWHSYFGNDAGLDVVNGIQFLRLNTANYRLNKPANLAAIEKLDPKVPAVIFSHMQLVPDDYLNDKSKVIKDAEEVKPQLEKIGRSKSIIYIGHKNVATTARLGKVIQINVPQTTQFPAGWLEVEIRSEGITQRFVPSCCSELEELSRLLGGSMMKGIGYRDVYSFEIWNRFIPWSDSETKKP